MKKKGKVIEAGLGKLISALDRCLLCYQPFKTLEDNQEVLSLGEPIAQDKVGAAQSSAARRWTAGTVGRCSWAPCLRVCVCPRSLLVLHLASFPAELLRRARPWHRPGRDPNYIPSSLSAVWFPW